MTSSEHHLTVTSLGRPQGLGMGSVLAFHEVRAGNAHTSIQFLSPRGAGIQIGDTLTIKVTKGET